MSRFTLAAIAIVSGVATTAAAITLWAALVLPQLPPPPAAALPDAARIQRAHAAIDQAWTIGINRIAPAGAWERFARWVAQ